MPKPVHRKQHSGFNYKSKTGKIVSKRIKYKKPIKSVNLIYLSHNMFGGWANFTAHLLLAFREENIRVNLYKIGNSTEAVERDFGLGVRYRNITELDCLRLLRNDTPVLITAMGGKYIDIGKKLLENGAFIVRHDPYEEKWYTPPDNAVIAIRQSSAASAKGAVFIPHPYMPAMGAMKEFRKRKPTGISISRIDTDKNPEIILDANRHLPTRLKIAMRGHAHTSHARFKLADAYPEFGTADGGKHRTTKLPFSRDGLYNGVMLLQDYMFGVDMSVIQGDGGGTQYTFMEMWNANTVPIIHKQWIIKGQEMVPGKNCLAVSGTIELMKIIKRGPVDNYFRDLRNNGWRSLRENHSSRIIVPQYLNYFSG